MIGPSRSRLYKPVGAGIHRIGADEAADALATAAAAGDQTAQEMCAAIQRAGCAPPTWRMRQLAPGVHAPCEDLYPLPFRPEDGNPTFYAGGPTTKRLIARPQKPFRGERPVAIVVRNGPSAQSIVPVIRGGIRVGTDVQVAQIADQPLEFFDRQSFGVRMIMSPAQPGVDIDLDVDLVGGTLAAPDTITVFFTVWGATWA
jgi:hypothetical protein